MGIKRRDISKAATARNHIAKRSIANASSQELIAQICVSVKNARTTKLAKLTLLNKCSKFKKNRRTTKQIIIKKT